MKIICVPFSEIMKCLSKCFTVAKTVFTLFLLFCFLFLLARPSVEKFLKNEIMVTVSEVHW